MIDISKLLTDYFAVKQQVHDAFGYVADWVEIPLDDRTDAYWWFGVNEVQWDNSPPTSENVVDNEGKYADEIYMQRFLPRWVYPTETHTMVSVDTHTDGNKFLAVFDNTKYVGIIPLADAIAKVPTRADFDKE
jgi:hypothetical protein